MISEEQDLEDFKKHFDDIYGRIEICGLYFSASYIFENIEPFLLKSVFTNYLQDDKQ